MALIDAFLYGLSFSSALQAWFEVAVVLAFLQGRVYILRLNTDGMKSSTVWKYSISVQPAVV